MNRFLGPWNRLSLIARIAVGLLLGVALGFLCPEATVVGTLGTLFVGALKAIAPLLVFVLVVEALANAGEKVGSRFTPVVALYLTSTALAAVLGVGTSFLFPTTLKLPEAADAGTPPSGVFEVFAQLLKNVTQNPVGALVDGNFIGVLTWAVVLGLALRSTASATTKATLKDFATAATAAARWVIGWAPLGILGLTFTSVATSGASIFADYGRLLALLVGSMLTAALVLNPALVFAVLRRNPYPLVFRCLRESGVPAFFTRSSAANIPVNLQLCKKLGLDENLYSIAIPLGATINMNGAAITIAVMSLAAANTLGVSVDFPSALLLCAVSTLAACGASGVAGGSLLLIPLACSLFGIGVDVAMQVVGIGFVVGVVQDSLETALNSSGDVLFAATAEFRERRKRGESFEI